MSTRKEFIMFNTLKQTIKNKFSEMVNNSKYEKYVKILRILSMTIACSLYPVAAYAGTLDTLFGNILGIVCKIFFVVGSVLLLFGLGMLMLSFKNDDADSKQRAIQLIAVSVGLMSIGGIYTAATNGFTGAITISNNISI